MCAAAETPAPNLDSNRSLFPDASLVDFSGTLDAPAGKYGFLRTGEDGHFYFRDSHRAIFFGINIAKTSVFQPHERIDRVADAIARAGFNMVRLHHVDGITGLLPGDGGASQKLNAERLDDLDYWIAALKKRGIYVYLDLLDYRTFRDGDGVQNAGALGRAAKPYAVFDRRLIDLQKAYAKALFRDHVNPYTHLAYADDPAVALVEICDENGLFIRRGDWRALVQPYATELKSQWNAWLGKRYGSTAQLAAYWTNYLGQCALMPGESIEQGTVELPDMQLGEQTDSGYAASLTSPARLNDAARFAYNVQRTYFTEMHGYLRKLGVKVPVTAVVTGEQMPDLKSVADSLDFVGTNFYWDHPSWTAGNDWNLPSFFSNVNPLTSTSEYTFAPQVAVAKIKGKPLVVREWGYCWPNRYRAAGMIEATAYGCLENVDAMLLFTYDLYPEADGIGYFDVHLDPTRWGLAAFCARVFRQRMVRPAARSVAIGYGDVDTFNYYRYLRPVYRTALVSRVENEFFADTLLCRNDLTVASGRSAKSDYVGDRKLLFCNNRAMDNQDRVRAVIGRYMTAYHVTMAATKESDTRFDGTMYDNGVTRRIIFWPGITLASLRALELDPIGISTTDPWGYGFYDKSQRSFVFNSLADDNVLRMCLDALHMLHGVPASHQSLDTGVITSDTGEITRDQNTGQIRVNTPQAVAVAGTFVTGTPMQIGPVEVITTSPVGAITVLSLDGKPLSHWDRIAVKTVTLATNTDERIDLQENGNGRRFIVHTFGDPPITTLGRAGTGGTQVRVAGRDVVATNLENGVWELILTSTSATAYSDTPGVQWTFSRRVQHAETVAGRGIAKEVVLPAVLIKGDTVTQPEGGWVLKATF